MSSHYVTHVKIERVVIEPAKAERYGEGTPEKRIVTEVGSVTVKAASLAALARKIAGHIDLFDDEKAITAEQLNALRIAEAVKRADR